MLLVTFPASNQAELCVAGQWSLQPTAGGQSEECINNEQ